MMFVRNSWAKFIAILALLLLLQPAGRAANADEEVVLTFNHPAIGSYYITALYSDNTIFLPSMELFNLMFVHYEKGSNGQSLQGSWLLAENRWQINVSNLQAVFGNEKITLTTADFRIGELDIYLSPALFERMFDLRFSVNMSTLNLSLQTDKTLPIEEKKRHEQLRLAMERNRNVEKNYPLLYPRKRKVIAGGMLDYNFGIFNNSSGTMGTYTLTGGMEILGGDAQGTVYGAVGDVTLPVQATNMNWRYALRENPFLSAIKIGQISTTGLQGQSIVGGAITNDPIEPRKTYNTYSVDGNTIPQSEVELYINNLLSDYTRADEFGYYRFSFPLTYGTVRINLRISTPSGQIITEERQLQIPFTFLPKGVVSYNIQSGVINDGLKDLSQDRYAAHGDVAFGLSNNITVKAGTDYASYFEKPFYYGGLSARLFDQYLLNLDLAPDAYYKATASVTYASSRSINLVFTHFVTDSLYNPFRAQKEIDGSLYMPFTMLGLQSGFRLGAEYYLMGNNSRTNYNIDFNSRLWRFNVRANYRDQIYASEGQTNFGTGLLTASVTYTFSRTPGVPIFVKGMFVRAESQYEVHTQEMASAGLQFSKTLWKNGRLNLNVDQDLRVQSTRVQLGFSLDLKAFRSTTQYTSSEKNYTLQETFNGSLGLDARSAKLSATNRQQVGRAAVSVLMFVDGNNNGKFDTNEVKVPARAIRLNESATLELGKDSILRITQLQTYWRYNAEVVQTALPNPNLAPISTQFSFVADPNRYKRIEIPLYQTGTIEGKVGQLKAGAEESIAGLRLFLKGATNTHAETIRTFGDGSFYAMNLLPGKYILEVDPTQLSYLNASSQPARIEFEVKALAEGDYLDNLNFVITPLAPVQEKSPVLPLLPKK